MPAPQRLPTELVHERRAPRERRLQHGLDVWVDELEIEFGEHGKNLSNHFLRRELHCRRQPRRFSEYVALGLDDVYDRPRARAKSKTRLPHRRIIREHARETVRKREASTQSLRHLGNVDSCACIALSAPVQNFTTLAGTICTRTPTRSKAPTSASEAHSLLSLDKLAPSE